MIALLTEIFRALAEYLKLKNAKARYELTTRIEDDIARAEATVADLRGMADTGSQLAADRLRDQIIRTRGILANLPAAGALPGGGAAGPDQRGDIHPAN